MAKNTKATTKTTTTKTTKVAKAADATAAPAKATAKKDGIRKPQLRILACLAKAGKPLTRSVIAEKAPVDAAACVEYVGSADPETRKANDEKHFPSLISLGMVKMIPKDEENKTIVYHEITAKGKAALAAAAK